MKSSLRKLQLGLVFAAVAAFTAGAWAQDSDAIAGTWKLNVAKSKFKPGPAPKSMTLKIEAAGKGVHLTSEGVGADDKPIATEYTANYDGKEYPLKGSPVADTVSLKRMGPRTVRRTDKKDGKVVQTLTRVIDKDGKSFTVTTKGKNAKGEPVDNVTVFEKQ